MATVPSVPRHPARRRRSGTALIAALCLLVQVTATLHLVLVRHAVCPEHGDIVHADSSREAHTGPTIGGAQATQIRSWSGTDETVDADDHCQLLGERRDLTRATALVVAVDAVATDVAARAPGAAPTVSRPLYLLAPKVSPPRVG